MLHINVIGLGIEQPPLLANSAHAALKNAQVVFGSTRQLASIAAHIPANCEQQVLLKLAQLKQQLPNYQQAIVLASGDPLWFGIGCYLLTHFPEQVTCHHGVSSLQGACHATGIALQDTKAISLHGRPLTSIRRHLRPQQNLLIITDANSQPQHLAQECQRAGLTSAKLHVIERMGYDDQAHHRYTVKQLLAHAPQVDPLHITVIQTGNGPCIYPTFPGIEDHLFITHIDAMAPHTNNNPPNTPHAKGMLTKREVRLAVLSLLQGQAGDIGWDIGAGCGGVAVEWALWNPQGQIYAIEHHPERLACLTANRDKFGVVQNLHPIAQSAPQGLAELPRPHKIFVGGSSGNLADMLNTAWQALLPGGRLVATAVMEQSKADAQQFAPQELTTQQILDATVMQIAISRGDVLAGQRVLRPNMAVMLYRWDKPYV